MDASPARSPLFRVTVVLALLTSGCAAFAPPRPLAANEAYWCCPGSAVPRRVALDTHGDLPGLRTGVHRSSRCGAF